MLHDAHAKSYLSESYINVIATQAGYGCELYRRDYGVDGQISEVQQLPTGKLVNTGCHFNVQIKASYTYTKNGDEIVYALDADAYDRLLCHTGDFIVLVLYCVPKDSDERVALDEDGLELRHCCYWYRVTAEDKKSLHIPRTQVFNPDACKDLMTCARNRDWKK